MRNGVLLQGHKGVECEYPENTMPSFNAAVKQGYELIELDLGVTKDDKIIVMHDECINSTARLPSGKKLWKKINISDITYAEALEYDFGIGFAPEFAGTKLPLFSEVLDLAKKNNITLKIDNKIRKFSPGHLKQLYEMIAASGAKVMISCWSKDAARQVRRELPEAGISFDGNYTEDELIELEAIAGKGNLYIWAPVDYSMAKWVPDDWWNAKENAGLIKKYAKFCIWAIESPESFEKASRLYSPYAAETTGTIKPEGYVK